MNYVKGFLIALLLVSGPVNARAESSPLWDCALEFNIKGGGLQLLVGHFRLSGPGMLICNDTTGNSQEIPVQVSTGGRPLSLRIAAGRLHLRGAATGIGVEGSPYDLLGTYEAVSADAAVVGGAGTEVSLHGGRGGATLDLSLELVTGFGFNFALERLEIREADFSTM